MESYDLLVHKEIVRLVRGVGVKIVDNTLSTNGLIATITDTSELPDVTKTFDRNDISFSLAIWGSKNGSSIEVKEAMAKVLKALSDTKNYDLPGYTIDLITVKRVNTFKEIDTTGGENKTVHYYHSILEISFKIKEEV